MKTSSVVIRMVLRYMAHVHRSAPWILLTLLFLFFRYQNVPGIFTNAGVLPNDTDPYYRLHRIESIVQKSWSYPLHDRLLSFPDGYDVPWPTGLDHLIALPLRLFSVNDKETIDAFASLAIPLLSLPALWAVASVGLSIGGIALGFGAALLLTFSLPHIVASGAGRVDHHVLEAMFTAVALALVARFRKNLRPAPLLALKLLLAFAPSLWPQAWVLGLFVALSFLLDREVDHLEHAPTTFLAASALSLIPLSLSERVSSRYFSMFGFSWWTPLLYALLALLFLLFRVVRRRSLPRQRVTIPVTLYLLGLGTYFLYRQEFGATAGALRESAQILIHPQGLLASTNEAISPLHLSISRWFSLGLFPLMAAWLWFPLQAFRRERWWLVGFVAAPLLLTLAQARFSVLGAPIVSLCAALLFHDFSLRFLRSSKAAATLTLLLCLSLASIRVVRWTWNHQGNSHPLFPAVMALSTALLDEARHNPVPRQEQGVAGPWDYGHWILQQTGLPVVAHPFQDAAAIETLRLFLSTEPEALPTYLARHPIAYMVIEAPSVRLMRWVRDFDRSLDSLPNLLAIRFFEGDLPTDFRLLYVSPLRSPYDPTRPALKLFEQVRGAQVEIRTTDTAATIDATVQTSDGPIEFQLSGRSTERGTLAWRLPYGAVDRWGVQFDGRYWLTADGMRRMLPFTVTEDDVLQGRRVDAARSD